MSDKIAVVTGSNKGIGLAIVRELCRRGVGTVYLTARDLSRGQAAVKNLQKEGYNPLFYQLEVTDRNNVKLFANHLKQEHSGIDILINNAAIMNTHFKKTTYEDSKNVLNVNFYSMLIIQEMIFPILKDNARVINMSSICGHISNIRNTYWINKLTRDDIKLKDIIDFINWFLESVKRGTVRNEDFQEPIILAYKISKIAIVALSRIQQKEVGQGISVNSLHPGFVETDMTLNVGDLTTEEASKTPVYLALDIDQSVTGKYFWFDKTEKDWTDPKLNLFGQFKHFEDKLSEKNINYKN